jgi:hypothetical protein
VLDDVRKRRDARRPLERVGAKASRAFIGIGESNNKKQQ